jgi:hypothetical protein
MTILNSGYNAKTASNFSQLHLRKGQTLASLVAGWQAAAGSCASFEVTRLYSATKADFTLTCTKKNVAVALVATSSAPYLIQSVSVH